MIRTILGIIILFSSVSVLALQEPIAPTDIVLQPTLSTALIANVIKYGIGIAGILGVIMLTWAGIQMIMATGDEEKIKRAKNRMQYALLGVLLAGGAYGIIKIFTSLQI